MKMPLIAPKPLWLAFLAAFIALCPLRASAGQAEPDTIYNPTVVYTGMPKTYQIAGITVTGAPEYDDFIVIGYSGLKVGDKIDFHVDKVNGQMTVTKLEKAK